MFHIYAVEVRKRDGLVDNLKKNGIAALIHYPIPLHLSGTYTYLGYKRGDFPNAEHSAKRMVSLPMFPELTKKQADFVVQTIKKFYAEQL